ncbi:MAG: LysR substrate-binding domain-containing protein [Pseudomonadota bacterium]
MNEIQQPAGDRDALERALPPLPALRAFLAAARRERLKDAAAALGVTESAVSHQVRRLEEHLGEALFERRPGGLALTLAGRRYLEEIEPAFARIAAATAEIMGRAPQGRVSLTLPPSLAILWLLPRLAAFEAALPDVALNLVTTTRVVDLKREQVDLAIRYGLGQWPDVTAELLMGETSAPICRPDFFGPPGAPPPPPETALREARLIVSRLHPDEWVEWTQARGLPAPEMTGALRLGAQDEVLEAAAQGLGLGMGRSPMMDARRAAGDVITPFGAGERDRAAYHLCRPLGAAPTAAARRAVAWLRRAAADTPVPAPPEARG